MHSKLIDEIYPVKKCGKQRIPALVRQNNVGEERDTKRLKKKKNLFDGVDSEIYKKGLKVQILNEVATQTGGEKKGLVLKIAISNIHQNFLASKYDIRQHSDAT